MDLVRDVLDKQLIDRAGKKMGKIDGLILEQRSGELHVAFLELGGGALARRLHPRLASLLRGLSRAIGVNDGEPFRIPWSKVLQLDVSMQVDVEVEETPAYAWERLLRERLLSWVPVSPFKK
jgi:sporulation protein YlmC with PRC-barrel domain